MYKRKDGLYAESITVNGKRKVLYGKTQAELKKKLKQYLSDGERGQLFSDLADSWYEYHALQVTYNGATAYNASLARAKDHFVDRYAKDITPDELQAYIRQLAGEGYSKRTVQLHRDMLNMIFDYAITRPDATFHYNPCASVKIPSGLSKTRREPPTEEQLAKITPDANSEMGLFAYFLLYTGLRRGELLALEWSDIDRDEKLIYITKEVYYEGNTPRIKAPKTAAGTRTVDLLDNLAAVLPAKQKGYVFGGKTPLSKTAFRKRWIAFCREVGLAEEIKKEHTGANGHRYVSSTWKPLVTPHQFRHAYASMLDDAGIDEFTAMNLLGHSSIAVTKDIYTHLRAAKRARASKLLNNYVNAQNSLTNPEKL